MRVLMFGWEFPPYQAGGLATATVGLVKGLGRIGVEVTLVVPFPAEESSLPRLRLIGAGSTGETGLPTVHRIESPLAPYAGEQRYQEIYASTRKGRRADRPVYGPDLFSEVGRFTGLAAEIARREPHDVIDAHDWITFEAGQKAREISGRPLVVHIHAIEYDRTGGEGNPRIAERERQGLVAADRVIANSHRLRRLCIERYGVSATKIEVVHWGVDQERAEVDPTSAPSPLGPETPVVLFLGRVTSQKGPDFFIEMAARVAGFVPRTHFVVAGNGDMLAYLIERSAELGIADRVHFTGGLDGAQVERVFRMADVCVMPSRNEPFGLVALESLQNGTPCVVAKDAGVAEVVRNVFKVDCWDVEAMTDKVVALLKHRALRDELRDCGRREIDLPRFTLAEPARHTADLYRQAITN